MRDDHEPDDTAWEAAGFDPDCAATFREWRIDLDEARRWHEVGVEDGLSATRWSILGASPDEVPGLERDGIDLEVGFEWRSAGFTLDEARRHVADGTSPDDARLSRGGVHFVGSTPTGVSTTIVSSSPMPMAGGVWSPAIFARAQAAGVDMQLLYGYVARHWIDDDALAWAAQGVDVGAAYQWYDLGLTAAEVGRLVAEGQSFSDVVRDWWPTGIPFAELADWIGAGLGPDEAVVQRSKGITVEHAAALRALRKDEDVGFVRRPSTSRERWGPPGPDDPPADEDAAREAIEAAFAAMTARDGDALPAVEGGHNLGPSLAEAQSRAPQYGQSSSPNAATVTVDRLRFVSPAEAVVTYTLVLAGGMTIAGRPGRAVVVDGVWKVARATFCELVAMVGVVCPPP